MWKRSFEKMMAEADTWADRVRLRVRKHSGYAGLITIRPYMSYGTADTLRVSGRVLKDKNYTPPRETASALRNLVEFYKRLESDEVPHARICVRFRDIERDVVADGEGYFSTELALDRHLKASGWHSVQLELLEPLATDSAERAEAQVLVPPATARYGVISDIDDTVLWSNVRSRVRMIAMLMRTNARTRKPFKGVAAFYRALRDGRGDEGNPIFYVSSSPWNLYVPLVDFLDAQGIPSGPLLLKDYGDHTLFSGGDHHTHKRGSIERILDTYPRLPFVLIGDSGEQDPEIYSDIVARYPKRIRVIYIRNINPDPSRIEAIDALIAQVQQSGAQLVLAPDSEFAATHAAAEGLITPRALADVRSDKHADESDNLVAVDRRG